MVLSIKSKVLTLELDLAILLTLFLNTSALNFLQSVKTYDREKHANSCLEALEHALLVA